MEPDEDDANLIHLRAEWLSAPRTTTDANPAILRRDAILADAPRLMRASRPAALTAAQSAFKGTWTSLGPNPINRNPVTYAEYSGRVQALAVDPRDPRVVYLGAAEGGIWKTTDAGTTWQPLTDLQPSLTIGSLALDPTHPDTVYAGTGDFAHYPFLGIGLLKSTDGGKSWVTLSSPFADHSYWGAGGAAITSLAVSPANSSVLIAGVAFAKSGAGVYLSKDSGLTWTRALRVSSTASASALATEVMFAGNDGNTAYAALGDYQSSPSNGVYRSSDGGGTWTRIDAGLPVGQAGFVELTVSPSQPSLLYASLASASSSSGDLLGLFKSNDGGASWQQLNAPNYCGSQCWFDNVVRVSPADANVVFLAGRLGIYRSLDGGATWSISLYGATNFEGLHGDYHAVAFSADGKSLYIGNDGGVWRSADPVNPQLDWINLNRGLAITQIYPGIAIDSWNVGYSFAGSQDNNTLRYVTGGAWNNVVDGDCGYIQIDPSMPNVVYASCRPGKVTIWKSLSGGTYGSWTKAVNGIDYTDRMSVVPPLMMDGTHPQTLYYGTNRVYRTQDGGANWNAISPVLSSQSYISAISLSSGGPSVLYAATADGVIERGTLVDAGASWANISAGLPQRAILSVTADPREAQTVYVAMAGWPIQGDPTGNLFRSKNGGETWVDIGRGLPKVPVNGLEVDPELGGALYAATDIGVYYSTDAGASWDVLGSGLPHVIVTGLKLHLPSRVLRIGTFGRGVWDLHIPTGKPYPQLILNGASYAQTSVSPGEIVVVFGTDLGPSEGIGFQLDSSGTVAKQLGGSQLLFDGIPAPLIYCSSEQINAVVPYSVAGRPTTRIQVMYKGISSDTVRLPVAGAAPALFTYNASGRGLVAAINEDGSRHGVNSPAQRGSIIVLYGTGNGQTLPGGTDGGITGSPLPQQILPVSVTIGSSQTEVLYAGPAPGQIAGVMQINARIPTEIAPGSAVPISIRVGNYASPDGTTVAIANSPI